jgi:tetratricopeptide (TPR) repeat protein
MRDVIRAISRLGLKLAGPQHRARVKLRRMGDRCRNRRNWHQAKSYYGRYLEIVPEDTGIWVQYGHTCIEIGDLRAAEAAYKKSIEIGPSSDAYLSLGRLLTSRGELACATTAFRKAVEIEAGFDICAHRKSGEDDPEHKDDPEHEMESAIVSALYFNLLKRYPDPVGHRHYTQVLREQGLEVGLSSVVRIMLASSEFHAIAAPARYPGRFYETPVFLMEQSDPRIQYNTGEPSFSRPVWQLCTAKQFRDPMAESWRRARKGELRIDRKFWEWDYILQALYINDMLNTGRKGLGFAVGREPLSAIMAARGCEIVATDAPPEMASLGGWAEGGEYAARLEDLNEEELCDHERFHEKVCFRHVDMNHIPDDLINFDFVWSSCAFEHIGSLEAGLEFVERAMNCLRPGGIAVHTTEFNLSSNSLTIDKPNASFYRKRDIEGLYVRLKESGHRVFPLNLCPGDEPEDLFVDTPPYGWDTPQPNAEPVCLKLLYPDPELPIVLTSMGIIVQRGNHA